MATQPELKSVDALVAEYTAEMSTNETETAGPSEDKSLPEKIESADETSTSEGQPTSSDEEAVDETVEAEAPKQETVKKPDPIISKGAAALAKKEQQLRVEREAFKKERAEAQGQVAEYHAKKTLAYNDPVEFLKTLGITDVTAYARRLLAKQMGANAPQDFLEQVKQDERDARIAKLEAELEQDKQQASVRQQQQAVATAIHGYLKSDACKSYPYLYAEASDDPSATSRDFFNKLTELGKAGEVYREMSDGEISTKVSEALEADIKSKVELVKKRHLKDVANAVAEKKPDSKTVNNSLTRATPSQQKKEATKLGPVLSTEDYTSELIEAAMKLS